MVFYDWQKRWQKEHPHATLYEAQLDAFLAGREAEKQVAAQQSERLICSNCGTPLDKSIFSGHYYCPNGNCGAQQKDKQC